MNLIAHQLVIINFLIFEKKKFDLILIGLGIFYKNIIDPHIVIKTNHSNYFKMIKRLKYLKLIIEIIIIK